MERTLLRDNLDLKRSLTALGLSISDDTEKNITDELMLLHAIRIGLMLQAMLWMMDVPRFTNRPDISMGDVSAALFQFDFPSALTALTAAFPRHDGAQQWRLEDSGSSYEGLYTGVFHTLEESDTLFKQIALGIANQCGGIG